MELSGWGRFPRIEGEKLACNDRVAVRQALKEAGELIPFGLGRSYGDSALGPTVLDMRGWRHLLSFDPKTGDLCCEAGVSLREIIEVFLPRGWFLPVTPGTMQVTVGGAVASDVHGKNHHVAGTFGQHVSALEMMLPSGEVVRCGPGENAELFRATCGGMGLTGVILTVTFRLIPVRSAYIRQTTFKAPALADLLAVSEENRAATYSVAWIDCLARGARLGRGLLMTGEHAENGGLGAPRGVRPGVPLDMPAWALNRGTMGVLNGGYYHRVWRRKSEQRVPLTPFFYPLDGVENWNRLYGRRGFLQYQCVLPGDAAEAGLRLLLERVARHGNGSFLAVLKLFGEANGNPLSFPREGFTLALDFKYTPELPAFLDELDRVVLDHGGRLYLAKDARMSRDTFRRGYPGWEAFRALREKVGAHRRLHSLQSKRLEL